MSIRQTLQAALLAAAPFVAAGCSTMNHTESGILGGAGVGGVAGALAGSAVGRPGAGAALGAAVGAVSGGAIGNSLDRSEARQAALTRGPAPVARGPLGVNDIIHMTRNNVGDDIIVSQIRGTGSAYELTADDIVGLKQNGVSDRVIREMQMTAAPRGGRRVYVAEPIYGPPVVERVYVPVGPPPPPHLHVGFGYVGGRCR